MNRKIEPIYNIDFKNYNQNYHSNPFSNFNQKSKKINENGKTFEQILQEIKQNFN